MKIKKLLVSEDDRVLIRFYSQALQDCCEFLSVVDTASEAIELLRYGDYDFLITDLKLEQKDGLDVVNSAIKYNSDIKILVASGYVTDSVYHDEMVKIKQIKGYLQKPFTLELLIQKIAEITSDAGNRPSSES